MKSILTGLILAFFITLFSSFGFAADVKTMSKEKLKSIMNDPEVSVLDARTGRDWASSEFKIKNADRVDPKKFKMWSTKYPKKNTIVIYCA